MKQAPCCAIATSKVTMAKDEVARVARRLAAAPHRRDYFMPQLEKAKTNVAMAQANKVDHDAGHAAERAAATTYSDYLEVSA